MEFVLLSLIETIKMKIELRSTKTDFQSAADSLAGNKKKILGAKSQK
jgi:hypothetical protein